MKDSEAEFEYLVNEAVEDVKSFKGWDFSHLTGSGRMVDSPKKWNYVNKVKPYLKSINTLLDMGTGGGEILSMLRPLPELSFAIEDYPPNIKVSRERLEPLGVKVIAIEEKNEPPFYDDLPFENEYFDLVINRHTAFTVSELYRILKPDGYFVTQQVGGLTTINLRLIMLGREATNIPNSNLKVAKERLTEHGFEIVDGIDEIGYSRYFDVGAIVYHLIACPWTIEDFTVDKYRDRLLYLHHYIERHGYFDMLFEWLFVVARKSG